MDRDRFGAALDDLIAAHGRKVRAGIDAAGCGTRYDWDKSHRADDAYLEARDAFVDEVFAPPPPAALPMPLIVGLEERSRGSKRGRPLTWRRWIEVRLVSRGVTYTFTADADSLTLYSGAVEAGDSAELYSPLFEPLDGGHSIHFRGLDYSTSEPAPPELVKVAFEACRAVSLRLLACGVDRDDVTRNWPKDRPAFVDIVKGEPAKESVA